MDATRKLKKIRKRSLGNENEPAKKKAKFNGSVEKETECGISDKNTDSEKNKAKDSACNAVQDEFNGKHFKKLLSTPNYVYALKKFVTICNENKEKDLAAEYLLANGSVFEVVKLLDSSDRKNIDVISIFSAINILLLK